MENPYSWGPVEKAIYKAKEQAKQNYENQRIGFSEIALIAHFLRDAGLIDASAVAKAEENPEPHPFLAERPTSTPKPGPPVPRNPGAGKARPPKPGPFRPSN